MASKKNVDKTNSTINTKRYNNHVGDKRKTQKKENINIRVSVSEKKKLEKEAKQNDVGVSEYVRKLLFSDKEELRQENRRVKSKLTQSISCMQDILNILEEKYVKEDNPQLAEEMEKLWELL